MIHLYLTGPDGSGKTSLMKRVREVCEARGMSTMHVWLRSPKITSKPLMAWCRLTGLTKYRTIEGIRYGAHEFYRSRWVSALFPRLQLIDFRIKDRKVKQALQRSGKDVILYDRYALDTLADLMVDTGRWDMPGMKTGMKFRELLPEGMKTVVLSVREETIRARKQDTLHDPHLDRKIKAYEMISGDLGLPVVDNNRPLEEVLQDILQRFELNEGF